MPWPQPRPACAAQPAVAKAPWPPRRAGSAAAEARPAVAEVPPPGQSVARPHPAAPVACSPQRRQAPWPAAERFLPPCRLACQGPRGWVEASVALGRLAAMRWPPACQAAARAVVAARCFCRIALVTRLATTDRLSAPPPPDAARWSCPQSGHWRDWSSRPDSAPQASVARSRDWGTARPHPAAAAAAWQSRHLADRATSSLGSSTRGTTNTLPIPASARRAQCGNAGQMRRIPALRCLEPAFLRP